MTLLPRPLVVIALCACASVSAQPIRMASTTPYADGADIAKKVRAECVELQQQLPAFTREFAAEQGIDVQLVDDTATDAGGRVLKVEITDAVSMGNAFIGHQKFSKVRGTLYDNGAEIASFRGLRNSMGGAFAGYKGSCSVLGRTMKALGKDIAGWLADPQDDAELGDM